MISSTNKSQTKLIIIKKKDNIVTTLIEAHDIGLESLRDVAHDMFHIMNDKLIINLKNGE
jgi:hypothetical protein